MMPLSALIAKTLGKRIGKATTDASVISGRLNTFFLEVLKGSKMIRIYQKEDDERKNAKNIVHELVLKNIKIDYLFLPSVKQIYSFKTKNKIFLDDFVLEISSM